MSALITKRALIGWPMIFWVYIIQSETTGRYYCGYSTDVERRQRQHNDPEYRLSKTTKHFQGPWKVVWTYKVPTRAEAMCLEKKIKKRGIGRYLTSSVGRIPPRRD